MPTSTLRTVVVLTAMFLAVAAAFAALVGFFAIGTSISQLKITAGSPACTGTSVSHSSGAIQLRPGMKCSVPVTVRNSGRLKVHLDDLVLPLMGSEGGAAVQVQAWDGRVPEGAEIDAVFNLDRRLEPGDTWETEIQFDFRPEGCTARGTFSAHVADVEASAWGRSVIVSGGSVLFDGTGESDC